MNSNSIEKIYNLHLHNDSNYDMQLESCADEINNLLDRFPADIRNDLDATIGEYAFYNQLVGVEIGLTHAAVVAL